MLRHILEAAAFVVAGTILLTVVFYSYLMVFHYQPSRTFHPIAFKAPVCKWCGHQVQGSRHPRGVPSTWEHCAYPNSHWCNGNMVEHS